MIQQNQQKKPDNIKTVFEHEKLLFKPEDKLYQALQAFHGENGVPFFSLINKGVKFNSYVGVIQVGKTLIEVLPKTDNSGAKKDDWRNILIAMIKQVGMFNVKTPSHANLKLKSNSILDLYFDLFLNEVEQLLHRGLIRKYRRICENQKALNGALKFNKHISENMIHKERFYVSHSTYDRHHTLHQIIFKTIKLIKALNTSRFLDSKIGSLLLNFPEMKDISVSEGLFNRIFHNRKSEPYRQAIEISRLLLLNYHPDVSKGYNNVLALMFDMNTLFEKYIANMIRRAAKGEYCVKTQSSKHFWRSRSTSVYKVIRPDIVITKDNEIWILDTKWKIPFDNRPSDDDLKQMYAYSLQFGAKSSYLLYPEYPNSQRHRGYFQEPKNSNNPHEEIQCSTFPIPVLCGNSLNAHIGGEILSALKN